MNLPSLLDSLEDEMDLEAESIAKEARVQQERGLGELERARGALKAKAATVDRLRQFADNMEARSTSNNPPPDKKIRPTDGSGSSAISESPPDDAKKETPQAAGNFSQAAE